jgi:hypothetical protein
LKHSSWKKTSFLVENIAFFETLAIRNKDFSFRLIPGIPGEERSATRSKASSETPPRCTNSFQCPAEVNIRPADADGMPFITKLRGDDGYKPPPKKIWGVGKIPLKQSVNDSSPRFFNDQNWIFRQ